MAKFDPNGHAATANTQESTGYELVSFLAEPQFGEGISLRWVTGSEVANCLFTVQRSTDRMNWRSVFTRQGEGGPTGYSGYDVMDMVPFNGISYYRLSTSVDGRLLDLSDDFAVEYRAAPDLQFTNEPIPGSFKVCGRGAVTNLQLLNNRGQFMPMDIQYSGGQVLVNTIGLEPGAYFVQAMVDGNPVLRTVIITATGVIGG